MTWPFVVWLSVVSALVVLALRTLYMLEQRFSELWHDFRDHRSGHEYRDSPDGHEFRRLHERVNKIEERMPVSNEQLDGILPYTETPACGKCGAPTDVLKGPKWVEQKGLQYTCGRCGFEFHVHTKDWVPPKFTPEMTSTGVFR